MGFFDRLFRSPTARLAPNNPPAVREAALQEMVGSYSSVFHAENNNHALIAESRDKIIPLIESGVLSVSSKPDSEVYPSVLISAESHPELHRITAQMNEQLNERYGTQYAMPGVIIVDNPAQIPAYNPQADLIILSHSTIEEGDAPSMIAHELAERQGSLLRGDLSINVEIKLRAMNNMEIPKTLLEKHRANECREDADAISLVGPNNYQEALNNVINNLIGLPSTNQLNDMSAGVSRGGGPEHYPTGLDRNRMAAVLRDNPELLERIRNNPNSIRIDGSCNITVVEARGPDTARVPQPVTTNEPSLP